jgi:galactosamine-6-phosphate isomerase
MLEPQVHADHDAVSQRAADWLLDHVRRKAEAIVCLAAGATPMRTYELVAAQGVAEPGLFDRVRMLKLDEWGGLSAGDPASCERHLRQTLIDPLGLGDQYIGFRGDAADPHSECRRVAMWLEKHGPIDACLLGLGINGHLGFNEPSVHLQPHAHIARLSRESRLHAMLAATDSRPGFGLTLGMADLLQARHIALVATGAAKRQPMEQLLSGRITTTFPASLLALREDALVLCDEAAVPRS